MRRCEDEKMRRCEDEKMRRCEEEKMRRCFTDPHYWKNPALRPIGRTLRSDALGNKNHIEMLDSQVAPRLQGQEHGNADQLVLDSSHNTCTKLCRKCA
jgi:hypothetical protein